MNINDLEQKIRKNIQTITKKNCNKAKMKESKIKTESRELMKERRNMDREYLDYKDTQ